MQSIKDLPFHNTYFLMRHGASEKNKLGIVTSSRDDYPLLPAGIESAKKIATTIHHECDLDIIYTSPIKRALQTAEIVNDLHHTADIITSESLHEYQYGVLDGKTVDEYISFFNKRRTLQDEGLRMQVPQGESLEDVQNRVLTFFKDINSTITNKNILFISHKEPLWMLTIARHGMTSGSDIWDSWGVETLSVGEFTKL